MDKKDEDVAVSRQKEQELNSLADMFPGVEPALITDLFFANNRNVNDTMQFILNMQEERELK